MKDGRRKESSARLCLSSHFHSCACVRVCVSHCHVTSVAQVNASRKEEEEAEEHTTSVPCVLSLCASASRVYLFQSVSASVCVICSRVSFICVLFVCCCHQLMSNMRRTDDSTGRACSWICDRRLCQLLSSTTSATTTTTTIGQRKRRRETSNSSLLLLLLSLLSVPESSSLSDLSCCSICVSFSLP